MGDLFREFVNLFRGDEPLFQKLIKLILVLAIVFALVIFLESAMGLVTIGRLERKVNLLKELNALTETGVGSQVRLDSIFHETVNDLKQYNPELSHMVSSIFPADYQPTLGEVLGGAAIWILMGLVMLYTTKGGLATKLTASGLVISIGLLVGTMTDLIIVIPHPILAFVLNALCGTSPLIFLGLVLIRRSQKQTQQSNLGTSDN